MTPTNSQIDEVIFSVLKPNWRKVAMIVTQAHAVFESKHIDIAYEVIGSRIEALCDEGRIDSQGNLANWRGSEVRLLQAPAENSLIEE